jgi:hypothetical protein
VKTESKNKTMVNKGQKLNSFGLVFILNIITTNKNRTAIAPTYTINNRKPKNSAPNKIKMPDILQKTVIKNSTEWMAFAKLITIIAEIKAKLENR